MQELAFQCLVSRMSQLESLRDVDVDVPYIFEIGSFFYVSTNISSFLLIRHIVRAHSLSRFTYAWLLPFCACMCAGLVLEEYIHHGHERIAIWPLASVLVLGFRFSVVCKWVHPSGTRHFDSIALDWSGCHDAVQSTFYITVVRQFHGSASELHGPRKSSCYDFAAWMAKRSSTLSGPDRSTSIRWIFHSRFEWNVTDGWISYRFFSSGSSHRHTDCSVYQDEGVYDGRRARTLWQLLGHHGATYSVCTITFFYTVGTTRSCM